MRRSKNHFFSIILSFCIIIVSGIAAVAQVLPLAVQIDMSNIRNLNDNDLRRKGVEELSARVIRDFVYSKLQEKTSAKWTIDDDAENTLLIKIGSLSVGGEIEMIFSFPEAGMPELIHRGQAILGYPAQPSFTKRLQREIDGGLFAVWPDVNKILNEVHSAWDSGEETVLAIDHQLDDEHQLIFSKTRAKLIIGDESARPLKRSDNGDAYVRRLATTPNFFAEGLVRPMRLDGRRTKIERVGRFCLRRQAEIVARDDTPNVRFACPLSGSCKRRSVAPEGWAFTHCDRDRGFLQNLFENGTIVSKAFASQPTAPHWSVPSLDALHDRNLKDARALIGFTDFSISTRTPLRLKKLADEVSLRLSSNEVPIWLDGVPPRENRIPILPSSGLSLRFGLQNLQLGGQHDGCESLDATLVFYANNEPTGEQIAISRRYAALRHPALHRLDTAVGELDWSGQYHQPERTGESSIFLASKKFSRGNVGEREAALRYLNTLRRLLEDVGLRITPKRLGGKLGFSFAKGSDHGQQLSVVGKIRPPRNPGPDGRYAFGLQVAIQQPGGLVQFTFDRAQVKALKELLLEARASNNSLQSLIPSNKDDFYVYRYTKKRNVGPDWVCAQ